MPSPARFGVPRESGCHVNLGATGRLCDPCLDPELRSREPPMTHPDAPKSWHNELVARVNAGDWNAAATILPWLPYAGPGFDDDLTTSDPEFVAIVQWLVENESFLGSEGSSKLMWELLNAIECLKPHERERMLAGLLSRVQLLNDAKSLYLISERLLEVVSNRAHVARLLPLSLHPKRGTPWRPSAQQRKPETKELLRP
jgi:hypothetical protein